jgi:hypothetical protein
MAITPLSFVLIEIYQVGEIGSIGWTIKANNFQDLGIKSAGIGNLRKNQTVVNNANPIGRFAQVFEWSSLGESRLQPIRDAREPIYHIDS